MQFSDDVICDLNCLAQWLALDDLRTGLHAEPELVILAGHAILPTLFAALSLVKESGVPVLFSGGIGHSTLLLQQAMQANLLTADLHTDGKSEAALLAEIATQKFAIARDKITVEPHSTNTGENARFSLAQLTAQGALPQRVLLVQDPLMQRRTTETFKHQWALQQVACEFISWPVFTPYLCLLNGLPHILAGQHTGIWTIDRYVSMLLGEMKRLTDDAQGYGPQGAGFIGHVSIPDTVGAAYHRLARLALSR